MPEYGWAHQQERAIWVPVINAGQGYCTEPICLMASRWIPPGTPWDLAHDRTVPGTYHGPAHARCNRSEGAKWLAHLRKTNHQPKRWRL